MVEKRLHCSQRAQNNCSKIVHINQRELSLTKESDIWSKRIIIGQKELYLVKENIIGQTEISLIKDNYNFSK